MSLYGDLEDYMASYILAGPGDPNNLNSNYINVLNSMEKSLKKFKNVLNRKLIPENIMSELIVLRNQHVVLETAIQSVLDIFHSHNMHQDMQIVTASLMIVLNRFLDSVDLRTYDEKLDLILDRNHNIRNDGYFHRKPYNYPVDGAIITITNADDTQSSVRVVNASLFTMQVDDLIQQNT
jgi:hypothetical protein